MADPSTISGLVARYRASDITGLADGAAVASWPDSSGSGYTATQTTAANQPAYIASSIGGQPAVRFAGSPRRLDTPQSANAAAQTVIVVMRPSGSGSRTMRGTAYGGLQVRLNSGDTAQLNRTSAAAIGTSTGTIPAGTAAVLTATYDSMTWAFYIGGAASGTGTSVQMFSTNAGTGIGYSRSYADEFFTGDIAELLTWNRILSAAERASVHSYVQDRYGITVADYQAAGGGSTSAGYSSSGSLASSGTPTVSTSPAYAGSGTLANSGRPAYSNATGYSSTGALAASGSPALTTTTGYSSTGTLAAAVTPAASTGVSYSTTGTLTAVPAPAATSNVDYSGGGTLAATAAPATGTAVASTSTGTLSAAAGSVGSGVATYGGIGALAIVAAPTISSPAAYSASGALLASTATTGAGIAAYAGAGTLTGTGQPALAPAVTYAAVGTLTTNGTPGPARTLAYTGTGTLSALVVTAGHKVRWGGSNVRAVYLGSTPVRALALSGQRIIV